MQIENIAAEPKYVNEIDIIFSNGQTSSFRIDPEKGDTFHRETGPSGQQCMYFFKAAQIKQLPDGTDITIPSEELLVILANTNCISRRKVAITTPTPEQKAALDSVIDELAGLKPKAPIEN